MSKKSQLDLAIEELEAERKAIDHAIRKLEEKRAAKVAGGK